jgi:hypothetical protein
MTAAASRLPHALAMSRGQLGVDFVHFMPNAPSSRAPDPSIKPHGPHWLGAHMHKELDRYPKCS